MKHAAFAFATAYPDHPAVQIDYQLAERETNSRASNSRRNRPVRDLSEFAENQLVVFGRNAGSVIGKRKENRVSGFLRAYRQ